MFRGFGFGFRVANFGFRVWGLGFRIKILDIWVRVHLVKVVATEKRIASRPNNVFEVEHGSGLGAFLLTPPRA